MSLLNVNGIVVWIYGYQTFWEEVAHLGNQSKIRQYREIQGNYLDAVFIYKQWVPIEILQSALDVRGAPAWYQLYSNKRIHARTLNPSMQQSHAVYLRRHMRQHLIREQTEYRESMF